MRGPAVACVRMVRADGGTSAGVTDGQDRPDDELVSAIASSACDTGRTVAVAESLTAGRVSALLGQGADAATWYRGAVAAYAPEVKFEVLAVTPGPVVTDLCARQMAEGVRRLLGADVSVGVTGVGGPDSQEGKPAGTVFVAVADQHGTRSREVALDGDPDQVVASTTTLVLDELARALDAR